MALSYEKLTTGALPTRSAMAIAETAGLLIRKEDVKDADGYELLEHQLACLVDFQKMSFVCDFEEALVSYYGTNVTEEQNEALELIFKSTQPWLRGHMIGELLEWVEHKDFKNSTEAIAAAKLVLEGLMEDGIVDKDNAAKLIINLAQSDQSGITIHAGDAKIKEAV